MTITIGYHRIGYHRHRFPSATSVIGTRQKNDNRLPSASSARCHHRCPSASSGIGIGWHRLWLSSNCQQPPTTWRRNQHMLIFIVCYRFCSSSKNHHRLPLTVSLRRSKQKDYHRLPSAFWLIVLYQHRLSSTRGQIVCSRQVRASATIAIVYHQHRQKSAELAMEIVYHRKGYCRAMHVHAQPGRAWLA